MAVRLNLSERFREPDFQLSVFSFFSAWDDAEVVNVLSQSTSSEQI